MDRAADGYARARGGELVPPGLGECGMRSAALWPSRGRCTRFRSGLATHGVVRDDFWLYLYVLIETVPTVPSSSSPAAHRGLSL